MGKGEGWKGGQKAVRMKIESMRNCIYRCLPLENSKKFEFNLKKRKDSVMVGEEHRLHTRESDGQTHSLI